MTLNIEIGKCPVWQNFPDVILSTNVIHRMWNRCIHCIVLVTLGIPHSVCILHVYILYCVGKIAKFHLHSHQYYSPSFFSLCHCWVYFIIFWNTASEITGSHFIFKENNASTLILSIFLRIHHFSHLFLNHLRLVNYQYCPVLVFSWLYLLTVPVFSSEISVPLLTVLWMTDT